MPAGAWANVHTVRNREPIQARTDQAQAGSQTCKLKHFCSCDMPVLLEPGGQAVHIRQQHLLQQQKWLSAPELPEQQPHSE
eukprot:1161565-Pelagomonas_calceolata.AAC.7